MPAVAATRPKRASARHGFRSAAEMCDVLDEALAAVNGDTRIGSSLQAIGLRIRIECPDIGGLVQVASSDKPSPFLEWTFERDAPWEPRLSLTMDSEVANEWLQGRESVPMAIARRRMTASGEARWALLYLPAVKLIAGPYRRVVSSGYPHLAL